MQVLYNFVVSSLLFIVIQVEKRVVTASPNRTRKRAVVAKPLMQMSHNLVYIVQHVTCVRTASLSTKLIDYTANSNANYSHTRLPANSDTPIKKCPVRTVIYSFNIKSIDTMLKTKMPHLHRKGIPSNTIKKT